MNVKCFHCGVAHNCNFCPNCGAPARPPYPNRPVYNQPPKKTGMTAGVIVGLSIMGVLVFILIVGMIGAFINSINVSTDDKTIERLAQTNFQKIANVNKEQEIEIIEILNDCGVVVKTITHDETLDNMNIDGETGYRISMANVGNIILYLGPDKTVNIVRYADNDLYIKGKIVSTISNYVLTWDEQSDLQISCQKAIKSILKSPSTARFPNITKWSFGKQDGKIIVQSYVDSQNSFGAELRSQFQFILSANDYTVKSLIFDGEEMISE